MYKNIISRHIYRGIGGLYFTFLCMLASLCTPFIIADTEPAALRIMTFNIRTKDAHEKTRARNWNNRLPLVVTIIKEQWPDIIGFQEATRPQIDDLEKNLSTEYKWFGKGRGSSLGGLGPDEATPIFYNAKKLTLNSESTFNINRSMWWLFKITSTGLLPRICTHGVFTINGTEKQITIFNTHLDHMFEKARIAGIKNILKITNNISIPTFLMGDFNTEFTGPFERKFSRLDATFINTKQCAQEISGPRETFTGWGEKKHECIDHILLKNQETIQITQHKTIAETGMVYPSDHRPVFVDVVIK